MLLLVLIGMIILRVVKPELRLSKTYSTIITIAFILVGLLSIYSALATSNVLSLLFGGLYLVFAYMEYNNLQKL